jgi:putative phosphoesterase
MTDTEARTIIVLADCHIHPANGVVWPQAALDAFKGADLFVTLGDMGERTGLETLARLAPVIGVRGRDDEDDPRTAPKLRMLKAGKYRIGCVFDPVAAGVALQTDPLVCVPAEELSRLFGETPDTLLWASTHMPALDRIDGRLLINPGSVTLPGERASPSFARLALSDGAIVGEIVTLRNEKPPAVPR